MSASSGSPYLNPNDTTVTRSAVSAALPKVSRSRARSSCTFSSELSSTRSASPRMPRSSSRSAVMPSMTRRPSCSGCGRRTLSNLRTSVSSFASRKTIYGRMSLASSSPIADLRSLENGRLRTSTTTAILGTSPLARLARSTIVGSRSGGRLSATNQSRSSSDFAAVLRPAPDIPVMITISGAWLALVTAFPPPLLAPLPRVRCRRRLPRPRRLPGRRWLPRPRRLPGRRWLLRPRCPSGRPEARHGIELAGGERRGPLLPVIGDREPVRLVPDALQQVQALAGTRKDNRRVLAGKPDFLEPLGQPAHGHIIDAELIQCPHRRRDLSRPAVDDEEIGRVGEFALAGRILGERPGLRALPEHIELPRGLAFLQIPPEPAGYHLVDRRDVVGAVRAADAEPAVFRLPRQSVLEDDHGGDHMGALQVGHVVGLDPQRRRVQPECFLDLGQRPAAGTQVTRAPGLVQGQRLGGVPRHRGEQRFLVPPPGNPEGDRAAAASRQPLLDRRGGRRQHGHEHLPRHHAVRARRRLPGLGPPGARLPALGLPAAGLAVSGRVGVW